MDYSNTEKTLIEAAEHSIGSKEGAVSARMEIRMLLEDYESRNTRLQEVMTLIEGLIKQIPMTEKLLETKPKVWESGQCQDFLQK